MQILLISQIHDLAWFEPKRSAVEKLRITLAKLIPIISAYTYFNYIAIPKEVCQVLFCHVPIQIAHVNPPRPVLVNIWCII